MEAMQAQPGVGGRNLQWQGWEKADSLSWKRVCGPAPLLFGCEEGEEMDWALAVPSEGNRLMFPSRIYISLSFSRSNEKKMSSGEKNNFNIQIRMREDRRELEDRDAARAEENVGNAGGLAGRPLGSWTAPARSQAAGPAAALQRLWREAE